MASAGTSTQTAPNSNLSGGSLGGGRSTAPALFALSIDPIWLGVMIAVNLQASFMTPPFGFSLFYFKSVAREHIPTLDIYKGVAPFVGIQLLCLILVWSFPSLATWLPVKIFG